ncbi:MAG: AfsR/SARP family transcriptional regulator, partial [Kibdelosporangium sp.]
RVAARARTDFPDGVWVCDLATVRDSWLVPDVLATTLRVHEPQGASVTAGLVEFLRPRRALLVIDNCEHVLDAAAHIVDVVARGCPHVTVLATGREPLGVEGEHVLPLRPLAVPTDRRSPAQLAEVPSVALFVDRAVAAMASFAITEANADAVVEICRRLDGLPLAIELAAARAGSMSVEEIAARLERPLHFLASTRRVRDARHSTLRAVIDWSYQLLGLRDQRVFEQLSLFAGSFELDDAIVVAGGEEIEPAAVVDAITGLVHRSMLVADTSDAASRFRMLETLRLYGREQLERTGRTDAVQRGHAAYCVAVAEATEARITGPDEARSADRVTSLFDDLRAAHTWALTNEPTIAIRISAALSRYTSTHGPSEMYSWADRAIEVAGNAPPDPRLAVVMAVASAGALRQGDLRRATDLAERGLTVVLDEDAALCRYPLWMLARLASFEGRYTDADQLYARVAKLAETVADDHCVAYVTASRALQKAYDGATPVAVALARRAGELAGDIGNPTAIAWADYTLAVALQDVEPQRSLDLLRRAHRTAGASGNTYIPGVALNVGTGILTQHGSPHQAGLLAVEAIRYWGGESHWTQQWVVASAIIQLLARVGDDEAAVTIHGALRVSGTAIQPAGREAERLHNTVVGLQQRLGIKCFARASARGASMSDDTAIAFAETALTRLNRTDPTGDWPVGYREADCLTR